MKFLFEFFPIILFFAAYKMQGIFIATAVAIAASACQIGVAYARTRKIEPVMWISLAVLLVFGGSTLLLRNEVFIKWKPTILYWLFAGTLAVSETVFKKNFIRTMLQRQLTLPGQVWRKLNAGWAGFFTLLGGANLFVAYRFSTDTWVSFKLFGILGCMLVFVVIQSILLAPYISKEQIPEK